MPREPRVVQARPPGRWPPTFVESDADRDALLVLAHLETLTPGALHALATREGTAARCLDAGLAGEGTDRDAGSARSVDVSAVRRALGRCGARQVVPGDREYPSAVLDLPDPPACLFVRGQAVVGGDAVTIVGARRCSAYGREVAAWIAAGVAASGVAVISGAALGIDAAAHRGALSARGPTVAIMGCGIDVLYPYANRSLIEEVARRGAVASEYPPGVPPHPRRFPARNRIAAALGAVAVVVEGAPGSGSLLTAEFAQDLGRDVLAVPGQVTGELSAVPHELIRDGATLVRGPADVLAHVGEASLGPGGGGSSDAGLPEPERAVLGTLSGGAAALEPIAVGAGVAAHEALAALMALELRGLVRSIGGRYERTLDAGRPDPSGADARAPTSGSAGRRPAPEAAPGSGRRA